jgi:putative hemolysin
MINVENLVRDNFPDGPVKKYFSAPLIHWLRWLFHEKEFQEFEKTYKDSRGIEFVHDSLNYFNFQHTVDNTSLENIPRQGRVILVANHPIGSLDGLALLKLIHSLRPDVKIVANQVLSKLGPLAPVILPVDNMGRNTARMQFKAIQKHLQAEGAIIVFPSGVVSRWGRQGIADCNWRSGFLRFSQSCRAPILPIHIQGRCSTFFYALSTIARKVSTLWLVPEMFKQRGKSIRFTIGRIIPCKAYEELNLKTDELVSRFRAQVYGLPSNQDELFRSLQPLAKSEDPGEIERELKQSTHLGQTSDGKKIYLLDYFEGSKTVAELGRLRELTFRMVEEGTGKSRDLDKYDAFYQHLILWNPQAREIVGAYRVCDTSKVMETHGIEGLYSSQVYRYTDAMTPYFQQGMELGRSFVQPRYWGKRSLDYLWYGIGALLVKNTKYRYLFGAVSISDGYPKEAKDLIIHFYKTHFPPEQDVVDALYPYTISDDKKAELKKTFPGTDYTNEFCQLKTRLKKMGCTIPTLFKQYADLGEPGGVSICSSGLDIAFSNVVDGFVLVDTWKLKESKRDRYLQTSFSARA